MIPRDLCHLGPDLSSSYGGAGGAGGVGGLVAYCDDDFDTNNPTNDPDLGPMYPIYDGNGNVVRMCRFVPSGGDWDFECRTAAAYEYGPFGEALSVTGEDLGPAGGGGQGQRNPFRFSTKYTDAETGLVYYGYRYYSPGMGRWVSRDPIGEADGPNIYASVRNAPTSYVDAIGLKRLVIAFGGFGERGGLIRSDPVVRDDWKAALSSSSIDWNYFYQTGRSAARKLVLSRAKVNRAPAGPPAPGQAQPCEYDTIIIIGFSWGGDAALALTGDLEQEGINVNLVFVVDPVKKPFGASFKKRSNVQRLVNRYQRISDIRGQRVSGADHELSYAYPNPRPPTGPNSENLKDLTGQYIQDADHRRLWNAHVDNSIYGAHMEVATMRSTLNELKDEVEKVPETRSDWK